MSSIEIIRIRTVADKQKKAMKWLLEIVPTLWVTPYLKEAVICQGLSAPTDLSVLLRWDEIELHDCGSDSAVIITEGLKAFGLVNHTIWPILESFQSGSACMNQLQGKGLDVTQPSDTATRIRKKRKT